MKNHIVAYKEKLEKGICEYMDMSVSERSANAVHAMLECLDEVDSLMDRMYGGGDFSMEDANCWAYHMQNSDGTTGAHWTLEQTTSVAMANGIEFTHITPAMWWITMNMMWSDYCHVADKFGVGTPEFYAAMAKAFLFDKDAKSPKEKISAYYHAVVE